MPIYEYRCASCGETFERLIRNGGDPGACPRCDRREVTRLLSTFGIGGKSAPSASECAQVCAPAGT